MYTQVLFQNRKPNRISTMEEYRQSGGYEALTEVITKNVSPKEVCQRVLDAGLRGRGGAGFPAGKKWLAVPDDGAFPRFLAANAEMEMPGPPITGSDADLERGRALLLDAVAARPARRQYRRTLEALSVASGR